MAYAYTTLVWYCAVLCCAVLYGALIRRGLALHELGCRNIDLSHTSLEQVPAGT